MTIERGLKPMTHCTTLYAQVLTGTECFQPVRCSGIGLRNCKGDRGDDQAGGTRFRAIKRRQSMAQTGVPWGLFFLAAAGWQGGPETPNSPSQRYKRPKPQRWVPKRLSPMVLFWGPRCHVGVSRLPPTSGREHTEP